MKTPEDEEKKVSKSYSLCPLNGKQKVTGTLAYPFAKNLGSPYGNRNQNIHSIKIARFLDEIKTAAML